MAFSTEVPDRSVVPGEPPWKSEIPAHSPLLPPSSAWRILRRRTGGHISRSTFYRWLGSGKVYSLRMGSRMYVPLQELQVVIGRCLSGEPF